MLVLGVEVVHESSAARAALDLTAAKSRTAGMITAVLAALPGGLPATLLGKVLGEGGVAFTQRLGLA